jgi:large subunit ribosomal protein L31e
MADETIYTIPLGCIYSTKPDYRRSNKAVAEIKAYLKKHTKSDVIITQALNQAVWDKGNKKPPRKIQVKVTKQDDKVIAEPIKA